MTALQDLIRHDAPLRTGAMAVYPHKMLWEKRYRFTSRYDDEVLLHRVDGNQIELPRALCPVGPIDERSKGIPFAFPKAPTPRPHQEAVMAETLAFLDKGQSGIVVAYTGWGKTVLGYLCAHPICEAIMSHLSIKLPRPPQ